MTVTRLKKWPKKIEEREEAEGPEEAPSAPKEEYVEGPMTEEVSEDSGKKK